MSNYSILLPIFLIVFGYVMGAIPAAYLAGKWIRRIDLRNFGSGTPSASMVWEHVSHWALIPVALFDVLKAAFPTWLGLKLGAGINIAILAGLAAVIGHNWSIFLNFNGGRGLTTILGLLLVAFPPGFLWMVAFLGVGFLLGDSAPWSLAGLVSMPFLVRQVGGAKVINLVSGAMVLIILLKRLEANRRPLPEEAGKRRSVILRRLFLDRDIPSHTKWISRTSDEE